MIRTVLVDHEKEALRVLEKMIGKFCPTLTICGVADKAAQAHQVIEREHPDLVLLELGIPPHSRGFELLQQAPILGFETIVVTSMQSVAIHQIKHGLSYCVSKPVQQEDLIAAVKKVEERLALREKYRQQRQLIKEMLQHHFHSDRIGIPTTSGYDFFLPAEIIRCEGMQRCTQIVTRDKSNIVSSYNIGAFKKILEPLGFFAPHRSHLINLEHVTRYNKEGTITMIDGSNVPVSKRKKTEFLDTLPHL